MTLSITTIKDLCKPIGRTGFAYDFPLATSKINPDDLKPLIGKDVHLQTEGGDFSFSEAVSGDARFDSHVKIMDISSSSLIVSARGKKTYKQEVIIVPLERVSLIEWNERIVKRISVEKGASER